MREIRLSGSEGGGPNPIESPYPYFYCALAGRTELYCGRCGAPLAILRLAFRPTFLPILGSRKAVNA